MENNNSQKVPLKSRMSSEFQRYLRVWKLLKKPSYAEFKTIAKISAIGLFLVGAIGFIISVVINLL
jgi:protein translocase SEC61 complex gamma subunit